MVESPRMFPAVSVVVPTFNRSSQLIEAIESVFAQTFQDFELIIVDDGSDDDTARAVAAHSETKIKYIKIAHSGRPAVARNTGVRSALGKYIAFLDSDDIWMPDKLAFQVDLMDRNPEVGLSYVLYREFSSLGLSATILPKPSDRLCGAGKEVFKRLYLKSAIPNSGVMIRKEVIRAVGVFDEDIKAISVEDLDLWLRIVLRYSIDFVRGPALLNYRVQPTGIGQLSVKRIWKNVRYLSKKHMTVVGRFLYVKALARISAYYLLKSIGLRKRPVES